MNGITYNTINNAEWVTSLRHRRPRPIARQAHRITAAVPPPLIRRPVDYQRLTDLRLGVASSPDRTDLRPEGMDLFHPPSVTEERQHLEDTSTQYGSWDATNLYIVVKLTSLEYFGVSMQSDSGLNSVRWLVEFSENIRLSVLYFLSLLLMQSFHIDDLWSCSNIVAVVQRLVRHSLSVLHVGDNGELYLIHTTTEKVNFNHKNVDQHTNHYHLRKQEWGQLCYWLARGNGTDARILHQEKKWWSGDISANVW